jgi:hypothetical protein
MILRFDDRRYRSGAGGATDDGIADHVASRCGREPGYFFTFDGSLKSGTVSNSRLYSSPSFRSTLRM